MNHNIETSSSSSAVNVVVLVKLPLATCLEGRCWSAECATAMAADAIEPSGKNFICLRGGTAEESFRKNDF